MAALNAVHVHDTSFPRPRPPRERNKTPCFLGPGTKMMLRRPAQYFPICINERRYGFASDVVLPYPRLPKYRPGSSSYCFFVLFCFFFFFLTYNAYGGRELVVSGTVFKHQFYIYKANTIVFETVAKCKR